MKKYEITYFFILNSLKPNQIGYMEQMELSFLQV